MSAAREGVLRELGALCGPEHVLAGAEAGAFVIRGALPEAVVAPGTGAALAQVMALSARAGLAVVPFGGGTAQAQGGPPRVPFLVVRTGRLRGVLRYEPADLTISVEAGMTLRALGERLREDGLMLPVDAPLPGRATLGGVLARAADGPRRLGHGTLRDLLIGISVVEASGTISKAGGLVVKNVSGFDMMKLYLGSQGTLAIIASANFKLLPIPRASATVLAGFTQRAGAFTLAAAIGQSQLLPVAVEYLEGLGAIGPGQPALAVRAEGQPALAEGQPALAEGLPALAVRAEGLPALAEGQPVLAVRAEGLPALAEGQPVLAVRAEGLPAATARHVREVRALAQAAGARSVDTLGGEEAEAFWARVADLPQAAEFAEDEVLLQLGTLPGVLPGLLQEILEAGPGLSVAISARALSGVAYLRVRGEAEALREHARRIAAAARAAPGSWAAVLGAGAPGLGERLGAVFHAAAGPPGAALQRRLRAQFDPQGRLNPGRMPLWEGPDR